MTSDSKSLLWKPPNTQPRRWAVGLAAVFVFMFIINSFVFMAMTTNSWWQQNVLPFYGILLILCGLASGVVGLVSFVRHHEHSWLVWLTILPGIFVFIFVLGEFLVPH